MLKLCPKCHEKMSMAWFLTSLPNEKYRCVKCNSVIGFAKMAVPLSIFIAAIDLMGILYAWNFRESAYSVLIATGFSPLAINLAFLFALFGFFSALNLIKTMFPSKFLIRIVPSNDQ